MTKKYAWSRHSDDEIWRGGPCDSIRECVEEALAEDYEMTDTFALGHIEEYNINCYFADDIIERLQNDAYDEVGEVAEDWLDNVSKEDREKLETRLFTVVQEWLKEIHELPSFYKVLPCEECTLREALEVHNSLTANSAKGGKINKNKEGI